MTEEKMTVEAAHAKAVTIHDQIRRKLPTEWTGHLLSREIFLHVQQGLIPFMDELNEADMTHYEVGLEFLRRHMEEFLTTRCEADKIETQLVLRLMGRVHARPPVREINSRIYAGQALSRLGERGSKLYDAFRGEIQRLISENREFVTHFPSKLNDEGNTLFSNPLNGTWESSLKKMNAYLRSRKNQATNDYALYR